jgi:hypothetical protein
VCADGGAYRALCTECDIELNKLVLEWVGDKDADKKIKQYRGAGQ